MVVMWICSSAEMLAASSSTSVISFSQSFSQTITKKKKTKKNEKKNRTVNLRAEPFHVLQIILHFQLVTLLFLFQTNKMMDTEQEVLFQS